MDPEKLEKQAYKRSLVGHLFAAASEEAQDLYWTAGNLYKAQSNPIRAADCFMHGVRVSRHSAGAQTQDYALEAGEIYLKAKEYTQAIKSLELAIDLGVARGTASVTASASRLVAQAYRHIGPTEKARDALERASALFFAENQLQKGAKCLLEVAELLARKSSASRDFEEAVLAYDRAIGVLLASHLHPPKSVAIKQLFCEALSGNGSKGDLMGFKVVDPEQQQFLERMQFAINSNDEDLFTEMLWQWDQKCPMDDTTLKLSLEVKRIFTLNELL